MHPAIAAEVFAFTTGVTAAAAAGKGGPDAAQLLPERPRTATSLVFLTSSRECAVVEVTSMRESGGGTTGAVVGGEEGRWGIRGGGIVATAVLCLLASRSRGRGRKGVSATELPSPILAAASLPPTGGGRGFGFGFGFGFGGGDLSSGPLIAILTVDGMDHVQLLSCVAVPLTSIEVGMCPNDFFTLSPLLPTPLSTGATATFASSSGGRRTVAKTYAGKSRLIAVDNCESPQGFADRLMRLCIDAFDPHVSWCGRLPRS